MKTQRTSALSRDEREQRRLKAGRLFAKGISQAEVVRTLGVSAASVNNWYWRYEEGGMQALYSKGHPGFQSKLTDEKRKRFKKAILKGPLAWGYETDLWTLPRLRAVLKRVTKVEFSEVWTWHIVRSLGFTPQKPQVHARERDEHAIRQWQEEKLPGLKKMGGQTWLLFGIRG